MNACNFQQRALHNLDTTYFALRNATSCFTAAQEAAELAEDARAENAKAEEGNATDAKAGDAEKGKKEAKAYQGGEVNIEINNKTEVFSPMQLPMNCIPCFPWARMQQSSQRRATAYLLNETEHLLGATKG